MAGRRNLCHTGENLSAGRTLATRLITSFRTGRCLTGDCLNRVTLRGDLFRLGLSAHCAGIGLLACRLTGGLDCDLALVPTMALRSDHFALLDLHTADGAHGIARVACLSAGRFLIVNQLSERVVVLPLCVEGDILCQIDVRPVSIGIAGAICHCVPTIKVVTRTSIGIAGQRRIGICRYSLLIHRAFDRVFIAAVCHEGDGQFSGCGTAPCAIGISNRIACADILGFSISAVGIVQFRRGNGDLMGYYWFTIFIFILIRFGLLAGRPLLNIHAASPAGADVRAAGRGVDVTTRSHCSVDVNLCIFEGCTLACLAGSIGHRNVCDIFNAAIATPIVHIIEI